MVLVSRAKDVYSILRCFKKHYVGAQKTPDLSVLLIAIQQKGECYKWEPLHMNPDDEAMFPVQLFMKYITLTDKLPKLIVEDLLPPANLKPPLLKGKIPPLLWVTNVHVH